MTSIPVRRRAVAAVAAGLVLGDAACRPASTPAPTPTPAHEQGQAAAIARARADSARLPWTEADAEFMSSMIGHHAQAIAMTRLVPGRTGNATIRTLAERIANAQRDEIATMQRWLRDRLRPVPEPDTIGVAGHAGMDHAAHHGASGAGAPPAAGHEGHGAMPGMLTAEQLGRLAAARGDEFDRLFLDYMIQHHRGATEMVSRLFGTYGAGQDETVFKFASDVNVDQKTEIARMQRMLVELDFQRSAP